MALRTHHSHSSFMVVLAFLLFSGISIFIAQTIATRERLTSNTKADETPKITPKQNTSPHISITPLPSGKPEILGIHTYDAPTLSEDNRIKWYSNLLFTGSGIIVLVLVVFLFGTKILLS